MRRKNHDPGRWEEPPEHKKSSTEVEDFALQDGLALGFAAFAAVRRKNHDPGRWEEPPEHKKFSTGVEDFALSICI